MQEFRAQSRLLLARIDDEEKVCEKFVLLLRGFSRFLHRFAFLILVAIQRKKKWRGRMHVI